MRIVLLPFLRCFEFSGRSRRPEFNVFIGVNFLIFTALALNDTQVGAHMPVDQVGWLAMVYGLITAALAFPLAVRRSHDLDATGWVLFLLFVPLINIGVLLVLIFKAGSRNSNGYGPIPRYKRSKY